MYLDRNLRPELCVSSDSRRETLHALHFDAKKALLIATDGHCLVAVPCEVEPGDVSGPIPLDVLALARRWAGSAAVAARRGRRACKDSKPARIRVDCSKPYPGDALHNWEQSVTVNADKSVTFAFDPAIVCRVAKALGGGAVVVKVNPGTIDPMRIYRLEGYDPMRMDNPIAAVMPCRL